MRQSTAEVLVPVPSELGEGPLWDARDGRLHWLDVEGRALHRLKLATLAHTSRPLSLRVSCIAPFVEGGWVAAAGAELMVLDTEGLLGDTIATIPAAHVNGSNDGKVDPWGRLWVGTVDRSGGKQGALSILTIEHSRVTASVIRTGVSMSNGLGWSPNHKRCYYVDTMLNRIDEFTLTADGTVAGFRTLVEVDGLPDGLTVDIEGGIWVALWDRNAVHRYTPEGVLDHQIAVPGGFTTSYAFGPDTTLYITTAWSGLTDEERQANPNAGCLFAVDAGVSGCPTNTFGLRSV